MTRTLQSSSGAAVALAAGEPAPFDGVLLSEEAIVEALRTRIEIVELREKLAARDRAIDELATRDEPDRKTLEITIRWFKRDR